MKEGYWNIVNKVVGAADVIVEVLDARFPALTRIARLEALVKKNPGKRLILAINNKLGGQTAWQEETLIQ